MKLNKKILASVLVVLLVAFALMGCSNENNNAVSNGAGNKEKNVNNEAKVEEEVVADKTQAVDETAAKLEMIKNKMLVASEDVVITETEVTFTDDSGRDSITIAKNPKKVAVLYGSHACLWVEAGGTVNVGIGGKSTTALYMNQIGRDIMLDEGAVTIATSSSAKNWDVETILAQQPDLIICSTAMSGFSTISGPAEAASIPVIAITYNGVSDYLKWFKVFSAINDKPELWENDAMSIADEIAAIIAKAPLENNPKVLSLLPLSKGASANLETSNMGAVIKDLNGINVAAELAPDSGKSRVDISIETIYKANPDMIFIQCIGSEEAAKKSLNALFEGNPVWDSLEAVKNDKVYFLPKSLFHNRPNHFYNESYKMMAELLYPELKF